MDCFGSTRSQVRILSPRLGKLFICNRFSYTVAKPIFFVGPFEPTNRQQILESVAIAEVPGALGLGRFYEYG